MQMHWNVQLLFLFNTIIFFSQLISSHYFVQCHSDTLRHEMKWNFVVASSDIFI